MITLYRPIRVHYLIVIHHISTGGAEDRIVKPVIIIAVVNFTGRSYCSTTG